MLDYQQLVAPTRHGGVLVAPDPSLWVKLTRDNAGRLNSSEVIISGSTLGDLRRETRSRLLKSASQPVVVVGHQPDFIHAGVWAKNVVAHRLAASIGGSAIHLAVDSDAPKRLTFRIPVSHEDRVVVREVRMGALRTGCSYEQIAALDAPEIEESRREAAGFQGEKFAASALPPFFAGVAELPSTDWVTQMIAGRRQVESAFGVELQDLRLKDAWWSPLAAHLLLDAGGFARAYNQALGEYRALNHVRSANRPIPDLVNDGQRVELPFWLYGAERPRSRAFCSCDGERITLSTQSHSVVALSRKQLAASDDVVELVRRESGWLLRPRALITTIWARLFLADLFIHGIGGAKYDRISDSIIAGYFGLSAPEIACVTATLYLDESCGDKPSITANEKELRDATWNPQRHLGGTDSLDLNSLIEQRVAAARLSDELGRRTPRDRAGRKAAFQRIYRLNDQIHALRPDLLKDLGARVERSRSELADFRAACDREYFFALHPRDSLKRLLAALPDSSDFV